LPVLLLLLVVVVVVVVNTPFQLMIYLPLFNPTKFHHYRIDLLSSISLNKGTELNYFYYYLYYLYCLQG
jgi:hypothetical protein